MADFALSSNIGATIQEIDTFLTYIEKNLDDIDFINLNSRKANGKGGSIHVHYSILACFEKRVLRIRFLHGLVGRHNEYFKELGVFSFDQFYKQQKNEKRARSYLPALLPL